MSDELPQRLRDWLCPAVISEGLVNYAKRCTALHREAADRIEALEKSLHDARVVNREVAWKECDALHKTNAELVNRTGALEAALRELAGDSYHIDDYQLIARRALEAQLDVTAENIVNNTKSVL